MQSFEFRIEDDRSSTPDRATVTLSSIAHACDLAEKMVNDQPHCRRVEIYRGRVWLFATTKPPGGLRPNLEPPRWLRPRAAG